MVLAAGLAAGASVAGSFMSNASSARQQKRAFGYARALQQQQYDLGIQGYKEAPSAQRIGLESAGYNPMLALGKVGDGVSVAGGTPVNANATDTSGIKESILQAAQLNNQTHQTQSTVRNLDSSTEKNHAETQGILLNNKYIDDRQKAEIANIQSDTQQKAAFIENMKQRLELDRMLGVMNVNAQIYGHNATSSAMRYGADRSYNASTYASDVAAKSTPFRYFSDKYEKYVSKYGFKTPYEIGYRAATRFLRH